VNPEQVRAWAQEHLDSEIIAIEPVGGGRTDTISAVYLRRGPPVMLRYVSIERWGEIGRQHVLCEALGCRLMEGSGSQCRESSHRTRMVAEPAPMRI
jgi:hypothetical protein